MVRPIVSASSQFSAASIRSETPVKQHGNKPSSFVAPEFDPFDLSGPDEDETPLDAIIAADDKVDFDKVILNPITCAMVDLNDTTPLGIDRIVECLTDIDSIMKRLGDMKTALRDTIRRLVPKNAKSKTNYIRGENCEVQIVLPSRSFNNSVLKKLWVEYSGDEAMLKLRDEFLRVDSVAVNMVPFKKLEDIEKAPKPLLDLRDAIKRCEDPFNYKDPTVKVTKGGETNLGNDPIIIQQSIPE